MLKRSIATNEQQHSYLKHIIFFLFVFLCVYVFNDEKRPPCTPCYLSIIYNMF